MKAQTFNDGCLTVKQFKLTDNADITQEQVMTLEDVYRLYYDERFVGMNRFVQYKQIGVTISRILRCPKRPDVTSTHIIGTEDGRFYHIRQIQYPEDVTPACMDLSLELLEAKEIAEAGVIVVVPEEPADPDEPVLPEGGEV